MVTEYLLGKYAAGLTRRYLTIEESLSCPTPEPDVDRSYLLYIHVPFCERLCPFCPFMRVRFQSELASRYFEALKNEIELLSRRGFQFDSVYVGGGTPTIMPEKLAEVVTLTRSLWPISQLSVETNPDHLVPEILDTLQEIGVNRLSVGVQSFDDGILESVERLEKYGSGESIKEKLASVSEKFETLNVDMIFNFPNQTDEILFRDIKAISELEVQQVTWYPLMVSDCKRTEISNRCGEVDFSREKRLYRTICEGLSDKYRQESIWCFSKQDGSIDEYPIEHDEYAGAGASSMGYMGGALSFNTFSIPTYVDMVGEGRFPVTARRAFSHVEHLRFRLLMELMSGSMDMARMRRTYGKSFRAKLFGEIVLLFLTGSATFHDGKIILTAKGRYYWLVIMRTLFSVLGDYRSKRMKSETHQRIVPVGLRSDSSNASAATSLPPDC